MIVFVCFCLKQDGRMAEGKMLKNTISAHSMALFERRFYLLRFPIFANWFNIINFFFLHETYKNLRSLRRCTKFPIIVLEKNEIVFSFKSSSAVIKKIIFL